MTDYRPADDRYDHMPYRRCGRSGLKLPAISLGLWHNFGDDRPLDTQRAIVRRAFDRGVTHFDLANNYGPPNGAAERNFGRLLREDLAPYRDELVISTKAGYDMLPGPYGEWGSRKYLLASLDASLRAHGARLRRHLLLAPLRPRDAARGDDGRARHGGPPGQGALRRHLLLLGRPDPARRRGSSRELGTPLLIHQPSYSMFNRWIEEELLDVLGEEGVGCIAFSPLAQGLLTSRYLDGVPDGLARAAEGRFMDEGFLTAERLAHVRALNEIAAGRGQTLAQMAIAWVLRDPRVTSALVGASSVQQLEDSLGALEDLDFTPEELAAIDEHAVDAGINIWAASSAG